VPIVILRGQDPHRPGWADGPAFRFYVEHPLFLISLEPLSCFLTVPFWPVRFSWSSDDALLSSFLARAMRRVTPWHLDVASGSVPLRRIPLGGGNHWHRARSCAWSESGTSQGGHLTADILQWRCRTVKGRILKVQHVLPNFPFTDAASSLALRFVGAPQVWDDPHFAPLDWSVDFWRKCRCVISHSSCLAPSKSGERPVRAFWTRNKSRRNLRKCRKARRWAMCQEPIRRAGETC